MTCRKDLGKSRHESAGRDDQADLDIASDQISGKLFTKSGLPVCICEVSEAPTIFFTWRELELSNFNRRVAGAQNKSQFRDLIPLERVKILGRHETTIDNSKKVSQFYENKHATLKTDYAPFTNRKSV